MAVPKAQVDATFHKLQRTQPENGVGLVGSVGGRGADTVG